MHCTDIEGVLSVHRDLNWCNGIVVCMHRVGTKEVLSVSLYWCIVHSHRVYLLWFCLYR